MVTKRAFSLIELIIVMGLLSLLMLAISSTMLMSIVSSSRIRTATKIKQAGNYAIGQMQGMIRSSKSIVSCTSQVENSSITIINPDGGETTLMTELNGDGFTHIASNSGYFLTPSSTDVGTTFSLTCEPSDTEPTLIKISFDLKDIVTSGRPSQNPLLHFETSVNMRNE